MWFVVALVVTALVVWLMSFVAKKGIKVAWYEWLIGIIGVLMLMFTIQNYFGSMAEFESEAASMMLLVVGLPSLILLAIAGSLAWRRNRSNA